MIIEQSKWTQTEGWEILNPSSERIIADLVLAFGGIDDVNQPEHFEYLKNQYPEANIVMSSTAGEILDDNVYDNSISVSAIKYEKTQLKLVEICVNDFESSYHCAKELSKKIDQQDLNHILVISDGSLVNGDLLVKGLNDSFPKEVLITGGLAADSGRFSETYVGLNSVPSSGKIVAIAHYGKELKVNHGSKGGWDEFGPLRAVTKSHGNVLYELDGKNALELYKKYLGEKAEDLPGAALLFPLSVLEKDGSELVRTILAIDEPAGSMTFAGDIPQGKQVRFMMANFDRLIDGAAGAAESTFLNGKKANPEFVLMISCVGRKIVLDQRVEEEVESVKEFFGQEAYYSGFYSNGEISPVVDAVGCSLHNQTMTITTYSEQ